MSNKQTANKVRLEWMYDPGAAHADKREIDIMNEPVDIGKDEEIAKLKSTTSTGSLFISNPSQASSDTFRRLNEDPLFTIKREEARQRQQLINNPIIRKKVKDQLLLNLNLPSKTKVKKEIEKQKSPRKQKNEISPEEQEKRLFEMMKDGRARDVSKSSRAAEFSSHFKK